MRLNLDLVEYYYKQGIYSEQKLCKMVEEQEISMVDFLHITRKYYQSVRDKLKRQKEKGYLF